MIHINNIALTSGEVLVELEEPFITLEAINKLSSSQASAGISKETRDANRVNTTIRHGKVIIMADDVRDFIFGDKPKDSLTGAYISESERWERLQYLRNPETIVLINIQYGEPFDVPMFKGEDDTKVGHCLKLNPSNIVGYLK